MTQNIREGRWRVLRAGAVRGSASAETESSALAMAAMPRQPPSLAASLDPRSAESWGTPAVTRGRGRGCPRDDLAKIRPFRGALPYTPCRNDDSGTGKMRIVRLSNQEPGGTEASAANCSTVRMNPALTVPKDHGGAAIPSTLRASQRETL
jgi:hypothetical protein